MLMSHSVPTSSDSNGSPESDRMDAPGWLVSAAPSRTRICEPRCSSTLMKGPIKALAPAPTSIVHLRR